MISYIAVLVGDAFGIAEKERFLEKFGDIAKNTESNKPAQLNFYNQIADEKIDPICIGLLLTSQRTMKAPPEIVDNILSTLTDAKLRDAKLQTICDTELADLPFMLEDELNLAKCVQGKKPNWDTLLDYYNFVKFRVEAQYIDVMNTAALAGRTGGLYGGICGINGAAISTNCRQFYQRDQEIRYCIENLNRNISLTPSETSGETTPS